MRKGAIMAEAMALVHSNAAEEGEVVTAWKIYDKWIFRNLEGKLFSIPVSVLNNKEYFQIISQRSETEIINYLLNADENLQTCYTEFISEALWTMLTDGYKGYTRWCYSMTDVLESITSNYI